MDYNENLTCPEIQNETVFLMKKFTFTYQFITLIAAIFALTIN